MIFEIGNTIVSGDIITEHFCCDLDKCKGACCIEGDAGAPVTIDEIAEIENVLDDAWPLLSASAQSIIDRQGVAYTDEEGDLVTSIVGGKDCVFTYYDNLDLGEDGKIENCCLCALEKLCREGRTTFMKPISCSLYPIRVKEFSNDMCGLSYNRWKVCSDAVEKGNRLSIPVYRFLREPLIRRFGQEWYDELETIAHEMKEQGLIK